MDQAENTGVIATSSRREHFGSQQSTNRKVGQSNSCCRCIGSCLPLKLTNFFGKPATFVDRAASVEHENESPSFLFHMDNENGNVLSNCSEIPVTPNSDVPCSTETLDSGEAINITITPPDSNTDRNDDSNTDRNDDSNTDRDDETNSIGDFRQSNKGLGTQSYIKFPILTMEHKSSGDIQLQRTNTTFDNLTDDLPNPEIKYDNRNDPRSNVASEPSGEPSSFYRGATRDESSRSQFASNKLRDKTPNYGNDAIRQSISSNDTGYGSSDSRPCSRVPNKTLSVISLKYAHDGVARESTMSTDTGYGSSYSPAGSRVTSICPTLSAIDEMDLMIPQTNELKIIIAKLDNLSASLTSTELARKRISLKNFAAAYLTADCGGRLSIPKRSVSLFVPPGALPATDKPQLVYIYIPTQLENGNLVKDQNTDEAWITPTVRCGPSGLNFTKPVFLSLPYRSAIEPSQISILGYQKKRSAGNHWKQLKEGDDTVILPMKYEVTILLYHFCDYGCTGRAKWVKATVSVKNEKSEECQICVQMSRVGDEHVTGEASEYAPMKVNDEGGNVHVSINGVDRSWKIMGSTSLEIESTELWPDKTQTVASKLQAVPGVCFTAKIRENERAPSELTTFCANIDIYQDDNDWPRLSLKAESSCAGSTRRPSEDIQDIEHVLDDQFLQDFFDDSPYFKQQGRYLDLCVALDNAEEHQGWKQFAHVIGLSKNQTLTWIDQISRRKTDKPSPSATILDFFFKDTNRDDTLHRLQYLSNVLLEINNYAAKKCVDEEIEERIKVSEEVQQSEPEAKVNVDVQQPKLETSLTAEATKVAVEVHLSEEQFPNRVTEVGDQNQMPKAELHACDEITGEGDISHLVQITASDAMVERGLAIQLSRAEGNLTGDINEVADFSESSGEAHSSEVVTGNINLSQSEAHLFKEASDNSADIQLSNAESLGEVLLSEVVTSNIQLSKTEPCLFKEAEEEESEDSAHIQSIADADFCKDTVKKKKTFGQKTKDRMNKMFKRDSYRTKLFKSPNINKTPTKGLSNPSFVDVDVDVDNSTALTCEISVSDNNNTTDINTHVINARVINQPDSTSGLGRKQDEIVVAQKDDTRKVSEDSGLGSRPISMASAQFTLSSRPSSMLSTQTPVFEVIVENLSF